MLIEHEQKARERPSLRRCPLDGIDDILEGVLEDAVRKVLKKVLGMLARIERQNEQIISRVGSAPAGPKYLTVEQVAEHFSRSVWTVRQLCNAGRIRAVKGNDGRWRIPAQEVARLEENGLPKLPTPDDIEKSASAN